MGNNEKQPAKRIWIPVEQVSIPFYGRELIAVRLEDGRIAAVLRWLCEGMGINHQSQMRHIQGRKALAKGLVDVQVDTGPGSLQEMSALTLDVLPGWLLTVDERRVKEAAQEDVVRFQEECVQVLAAHFAQKQRGALSALPASPTEVAVVEAAPAAPLAPAKPPNLAPDATPEAHRAWRQLMREWLNWQDDLDHWRATTDARQEALDGRIEVVEGQVGEIARIMPEIMERLGSQPLSPVHQSAVQRGVNLLNELIGTPHAHLYNDLRRSFKVGSYNQIPDARWPEVVTWFRLRIQAAERQARTVAQHNPFDEQTPEQGSLF